MLKHYKKQISGILLGIALLCSQQLYANVQVIMAGGSSGMSFIPSSGVTLSLGDTVVWIWDNGLHTTTSTTIPAGATPWDEVISSSSPSYMYVPTVPGIYNYKCIPHESMGMTGSFTVCSPPAVPAISPADPVIACAGDSASLLSASSEAGATFQWNLNGNPINEATNPQLLPDESGSYTCTVTNPCGSATSDAVSVTLEPAPSPAFSFTVNNMQAIFSNTTADTAAITWLWDFGDGDTDTGTNTQHTYVVSGNYTVVLTATFTTGSNCAGMANAVVAIGNVGIKDFPGNDEGDYIVSPNPASDYLNIRVPSTTILTAGIYDYTGRIVMPMKSMSPQQGILSIDINRLKPGNYLTLIRVRDKVIVRKFTLVR